MFDMMMQTPSAATFIFNGHTFRGFYSFFAGTVCAAIYKGIIAPQEDNDKARRRIVAFCACILAGLFLLIKIFGGAIYGNSMAIFAWLIAPCIIFLSIELHPLKWILSLPPFQWLARISFSIYLWHYPVGMLFYLVSVRFGLSVDYSSKLTWLLFSAVVITVSVPSHLYLEKRASKRLNIIYEQIIKKEV